MRGCKCCDAKFRCFDLNLNNEQTETTNVDFVNESVNKRFVELKKIEKGK
jgi:hypothetical protein